MSSATTANVPTSTTRSIPITTTNVYDELPEMKYTYHQHTITTEPMVRKVRRKDNRSYHRVSYKDSKQMLFDGRFFRLFFGSALSEQQILEEMWRLYIRPEDYSPAEAEAISTKKLTLAPSRISLLMGLRSVEDLKKVFSTTYTNTAPIDLLPLNLVRNGSDENTRAFIITESCTRPKAYEKYKREGEVFYFLELTSTSQLVIAVKGTVNGLPIRTEVALLWRLTQLVYFVTEQGVMDWDYRWHREPHALPRATNPAGVLTLLAMAHLNQITVHRMYGPMMKRVALAGPICFYDTWSQESIGEQVRRAQTLLAQWEPIALAQLKPDGVPMKHSKVVYELLASSPESIDFIHYTNYTFQMGIVHAPKTHPTGGTNRTREAWEITDAQLTRGVAQDRKFRMGATALFLADTVAEQQEFPLRTTNEMGTELWRKSETSQPVIPPVKDSILTFPFTINKALIICPEPMCHFPSLNSAEVTRIDPYVSDLRQRLVNLSGEYDLIVLILPLRAIGETERVARDPVAMISRTLAVLEKHSRKGQPTKFIIGLPTEASYSASLILPQHCDNEQMIVFEDMWDLTGHKLDNETIVPKCAFYSGVFMGATEMFHRVIENPLLNFQSNGKVADLGRLNKLPKIRKGRDDHRRFMRDWKELFAAHQTGEAAKAITVTIKFKTPWHVMRRVMRKFVLRLVAWKDSVIHYPGSPGVEVALSQVSHKEGQYFIEFYTGELDISLNEVKPLEKAEIDSLIAAQHKANKRVLVVWPVFATKEQDARKLDIISRTAVAQGFSVIMITLDGSIHEELSLAYEGKDGCVEDRRKGLDHGDPWQTTQFKDNYLDLIRSLGGVEVDKWRQYARKMADEMYQTNIHLDALKKAHIWVINPDRNKIVDENGRPILDELRGGVDANVEWRQFQESMSEKKGVAEAMRFGPRGGPVSFDLGEKTTATVTLGVLKKGKRFQSLAPES
ncbi:hypothetical protein [Sponge holobiont-associated RNA virus]|nr:hypothetical protein [Sponge holobiont-associated RNA virus]